MLQYRQFLRVCFDYISSGYGEIFQFEELPMDVPKLLKAKRQAISSCISEELCRRCHFEPIFISLHILEVLKILKEESEINQL